MHEGQLTRIVDNARVNNSQEVEEQLENATLPMLKESSWPPSFPPSGHGMPCEVEKFIAHWALRVGQ